MFDPLYPFFLYEDTVYFTYDRDSKHIVFALEMLMGKGFFLPQHDNTKEEAVHHLNKLYLKSTSTSGHFRTIPLKYKVSFNGPSRPHVFVDEEGMPEEEAYAIYSILMYCMYPTS